MRVAVSSPPITVSRMKPERARAAPAVAAPRPAVGDPVGARTRSPIATSKPSSATIPTTGRQPTTGRSSAATAGSVALPISPEKL